MYVCYSYTAPEMLIFEDQDSLGVKKCLCPPDMVTDIFVLGSCVLEMVTREVAYSNAQEDVKTFHNRMLKHHYPYLMQRVPEGFMKNFILRCCAERESRPTAVELLKDPWFDKVDEAELLGRRRSEVPKIARAMSEPLHSSVLTSLNPVLMAPAGKIEIEVMLVILLFTDGFVRNAIFPYS